VAVTAKKHAESAPEFSAIRFLREVFDELRKVVWPTWGELYRYTLIVIFTVIVIGAFIGGVDYALGVVAQRLIYGATSS
jgi:preprotein translocase subunit SecE